MNKLTTEIFSQFKKDRYKPKNIISQYSIRLIFSLNNQSAITLAPEK